MPPLRLCYLTAAIGFSLSAVGSALGTAPSWPNDVTWTVVAAGAALSLLAYAARPTLHTLDLATSTVVVAAVARVVGWIYSAPEWSAKLAAAGTWVIVAALMFLVHRKARAIRSARTPHPVDT